MSSHPDANSFVQAILRDPAEVTTRLAFADWLDETGTPSNAAWAQFIRLNAQIAACPPGVRREELITETFECEPLIQARLTLSASRFIRNHVSLEQLLPHRQLTVRLGNFTPEAGVVALFTRTLCELYRMLPLAWATEGEGPLVALADVSNVEVWTDDIEALTGFRRVVAVHMASDDVRRGILAHVPDAPLPEFGVASSPQGSHFGDLIEEIA